jgi:MFS family permease
MAASPAPGLHRSSPRLLLGEPWRAWVALLIGVLAVTAQTASSITVSVLMKSIVAELQWSRAEFASAATLRLIAMIIAMPFAGQLIDRLGARTILGGGALLAGGCVFAMSAVHTLPQLWAISIAMGPAQACIGSVGASALVLRLFERRRGLAVGILNGGDNLLNAAIPVVTVGLLEDHGWRATLAVMAGAYLVLAALIAVCLRASDGRESPGERADAAPQRVRDRLRTDHRWWVVLVVFSAIYAYITSLQLHFHAYQTDSGLTPAAASWLMSVQILVGALGATLMGWLAGRTSARTALVVSVAGLAVSAGVIWNVHGESALTAWAVFHGLVNGGVVAVLALVLHELAGGAQRIGGLLGVTFSVCMGATLIGNQWSAWMFDRLHTYVPAWQVFTGLLVLVLPLAIWVRRAPAPVAGAPNAKP